MPTLICPRCEAETARALDYPSSFAHVNYYRCSQCGHVWTTPKSDPTNITHVTPLKPFTR
jgi:rubredoxin